MSHQQFRLPRRPKRRSRRHLKEHRPPGTIAAFPGATPTTLRVTRYSATAFEQDEYQVSAQAGFATQFLEQDPKTVLWIDIVGFQITEVVSQITMALGLYPLAIEDAIGGHGRPKVDFYPDSLFLLARAHTAGTVDTEQIGLFLGREFVVSFRENPSELFEPIYKRVESVMGRIRQHGADYLLSCLLDVVVDSFFPALEAYGERLDALDDGVFQSNDTQLISEIHQVRAELLSIRRAVWPLRDAISSLIRDSGEWVTDETGLFLRDCYDHVVQIIDVVETDREMCADLRDYFLSVSSNRMNQVMKFLTIIATLFMPLSFIAALYGMNFNTRVSAWNMPELNWTMGYPFALACMAAIGSGMIWFFGRRGWL